MDIQEFSDNLEKIEADFKAKIERLYGKIGTTEFAREYASLKAIVDRLKAAAADARKAAESSTKAKAAASKPLPAPIIKGR